MTTLNTYPNKTEESHVTVIQSYDDLDYVVLVGASNPNLWEEVKQIRLEKIKEGDFLSKPGEVAQFINQGIRQLRLYQNDKREKDNIIYFIFKGDYEDKALNAVRTIVTGEYKSKFVVIDNIEEFHAYLDSRLEKKRMIKYVAIYSHGLVGSIEFGYNLFFKKDSYRFDKENAKRLKQEVFHHDAIIASYACRTGVGADYENFSSGINPRYSQSLAQAIADSGDVLVHAFPRRSLYAFTYGTKEERERGIATKEKINTYNAAKKKYNESINDYVKQSVAYDAELEEYRRKSGKKDAKSIPGKPMLARPAPPVRDYTDDDEELALRDIAREKNQDDSGIPIDPYGARGKVVSGQTPEGLPEGIRLYEPASWKANENGGKA